MAKGKRLEADGRKRLFGECVLQEDRVIGKGVHRRTLLTGSGSIA